MSIMNCYLVTKKEWSIDTCYYVDDPGKHAKWRHKRPTTYMIFYLYEISRTGKSRDRNRVEVA